MSTQPEPIESQQPADESQGVPAQQSAPLEPPPPAGHTPVLQKLSSPPFHRTGFPLLGILASVYEHVTEVAARSRGCGSLKQASTSDEQRPA